MKRAFNQAFCDAQLDAFGAAEVMVATKVRPGLRACSECGATQTPQWRQGPAGPQTLCNACGVRYSRLMRKGSKGSRRRPIPLHDDASDDSVSDDTSKGTTIMLMPPPSSSPAGSPARSHPFQQASLTPFSHAEAPGLAASRVRRHGLITTGLPAGLPAPEAVMAAALPPVSSSSPHAVTRLVSLRASSSCGLLRLGSSTTTTTNLPALSQPMEAKPQVEPEDTDCEAALNLLSMAAGHAPCAVDTLGRRSSEEVGAQKLRRVDHTERRARDVPCLPARLPAATTPTSTQQVQQRQHQPQLQRQQLQQQACSSPGSSDSSAAASQLHLQLHLQQQRQQQALAAALQERQLQQLLPAAAAAATSSAGQQLRGDAMQALLARIAREGPAEAAAGAADADPAAAGSAGSEPAAASQLDGMQALMSRLNAEEQRTLRALCTRFDVCFQEMVAAQAACEAVAQILRAKQEAARAAQLSARAAAQLLLLTATELSVHRTGQQTMRTVDCSPAAATTSATVAAVAATAAAAATPTTTAATPTAAAATAPAEAAQPAGADSTPAGGSTTAST